MRKTVSFFGMWLALGTTAVAQDISSLFFDSVDVYVVNVEVVVTDSEGNPITGLTREDFEVRDDGEVVEITNFFAVENRGAPAPQGTDVSAVVADDVVAPKPETERLNLVVFVDNFNMRPENRNRIFENLETYLREGLDPRDRVMLVAMSDSVKIAQTFTNDVESLISTLDGLKKETGAHLRFEAQRSQLLRNLQRAELTPAASGSFGNADFEAAELTAERLANDVRNLVDVRFGNVRSTIAALELFTDSLAGMKGRKAMLYVSDGLPLRAGDALAQSWVNKFENWIFAEGADLQRELSELTLLGGSASHDATPLFETLVERASANRVAFYPIANGGLSVGSRVSAEFGGGGTSTGVGPLSHDVLALESASLDGSLLQLANGTGGIAFTNSDNIGGLLDRMSHDFSTFYSLGYSPARGVDEEFHEVDIKVKREGAVVRYLKGYQEKKPRERLLDLTSSAARFDLADNPLEIQLAAGEQKSVGKGRFRVPLTVNIPFQKLLLVPQEAVHVAQLSLFIVVGDAESQGFSTPQEVDLPVEVPNSQILEALKRNIGYEVELDLKKGQKRISVGVRDNLGQVDSTVNLDLVVGPDGQPATTTGH